MEESNNSSDEEDYSCELPSCAQVFCLAELNLLAEQRHPEIDKKNKKLDCINHSRFKCIARISERVFQRFDDNKVQHKVSL